MFVYSVIIPHKDCPTLLYRCIRSIPQRDDIEVIVIDDNSNDIEPLKELLNKTLGQVEILFTKKGKGAGFARNQGLLKASGKWLLFADADDYFTDDAFDVFDRYKDAEGDLVVFKHRSVISDTGEETKRSDSRNGFIEDFLENKNEQTEARLRYCNDVPWAKMVKRDLVVEHHIQFDEVPASNDTMFSLMAGYYAKSIIADKNAVYNVTVRQGSITKTKSVERYFSDHCVALRKNMFLREIGHPECQEVILTRLFIVLKNFGVTEFLRFMKEVKHYKGPLFFGLSKKLGIK